MRSKIISAILCLILASSCVTAKFQPGKPVSHGWFFNTWSQGDERVSEHEVRDYLKTQPDTASRATASQTWQYVGIVPTLVGGFLIGYNLVDSKRTSDTGLWIGIGLGMVGALCGITSQNLLSDAVDTYNQKLGSGKKSELKVAPLLMTQSGESTPGAGLALSLSFR